MSKDSKPTKKATVSKRQQADEKGHRLQRQQTS